MAWKLVNPNITNDPSYLDPRLSDDESKISSNTTSLAQKATKGTDIPVSVLDFKCADGQYVQGDGIHDDTTGIQAAMDYASANHGSLKFPPLIYKTTAKLTLTTPIVMYGDFMRGDIGQGASKSAGAMIQYNGSDVALEVNGANGFFIKSLRFGASGGLKPKGISILNTTESNLSDVQFNGGFSSALYIQTYTIATIERCKFAANDIGIQFNQVNSSDVITDINIVGCNFWQNNIAHVKANLMQNINFIGNHFEWAPKAFWLVNDGYGGGIFRNVSIKQNNIFTTNATLYPDPRCIKFESTVASALFNIKGLIFEDNVVNMYQSLYPIEFKQNGNTNGSSSVLPLVFRRNLLWGGSTSAIYSDWGGFSFNLSNNDPRSSFEGSSVTEITGTYKVTGMDSIWDYNQIKGTMRLGQSASTVPAKGDMYYGTSDDTVRVYTPTGTKTLAYTGTTAATKVTNTLPTADSTQRGNIVYLAVTGAADVPYICLYNGSGGYAWHQINVT